MSTSVIDCRSPLDRVPIPAVVVTLGLATVVIGLLTETWLQRWGVLLAAGGILGFGLGMELWRRQQRFVGGCMTLLGFGVVAYGLLHVTVGLASISHRLVLLSGILGLVVLAIALVPARQWYTRGFVIVGAGLLYTSVLVSGLLQTVAIDRLLVAGAATVVVWDMADRGVTLGRQVGRDARTGRLTGLHLAVSAFVLGVMVILAVGLLRVVRVGLSFTALMLLLLSSVVFLMAVRH